MKHKVISLYKSDIETEVVQLQKKVFDFFSIPLEQVSFDGMHSTAIENYVKNNNDWDSITIFDVDCIPITHDCVSRAIKEISDNNTIYGNGQASNSIFPTTPRTPPFIAPSFLSFSRDLWERSPFKNFDFQRYPNPEGISMEADVAEVFTRENEKAGRRIAMNYPTRCLTKIAWNYFGGYGYKEFGFGIATEFESGTYHNFQIRLPEKQKYFFDYCDKLMRGEKIESFVS